MNIPDLKISDKEKMVLGEMQDVKSIAQVAALLESSYGSAFTKLLVWEARGFVKKIKKGRQNFYHLNQDEIQIENGNNN